MALIFNGTNIYGVNYNGTSLTQVNYNGVAVWYALTACTISGTTKVGYTLSAKTTPSEVQSLCSYQWYRGSTAISGATKSSYTLTTSDRGYQMKCIAKIGNASATSNVSSTVLQDITSISISGVNEEGYTLTATVSPSGSTGTYQWYRGSTAISGANKSTYTLTHGDAGNKVKCVYVANGSWTGTVTSSQTDTVWGWYDWSSQFNNSTSSYVTEISASYTIPSNVTCTLIECSASAYNHQPSGAEERSTAQARIYVNGNKVKEGDVGEGSPGGNAWSSCNISGSWGSGTNIVVQSGGNSFKRAVYGTVSGKQRRQG